MKFSILVLISFLLLTSCAAPRVEAVKSSRYPAWVLNPSGAGYVGGVGIAGTHVKGKSAQRALAISRALEDIAAQIGVKIDVTSVIETSADSEKSKNRAEISSFSVHTINNQVIRAKIIEIWQDPEINELYVYMRLIE